jgi:hypothetical protein
MSATAITFPKFISACIESNKEEFNQLLDLYTCVDSFKEKVLLKYFLLLKEEEKTIKLFQTFSIPILIEHIQFAHKHNLVKLLYFFSNKCPDLFFQLFPQKHSNFFKQFYFDLFL